MRNLSLFLLKVFGLSLCFFALWTYAGEYALWLLGKAVTVPLTVFGYQPTGMEVAGKAVRFVSSIPGNNRTCDVELAPVGFIVFLSLASATAPVALRRRLKLIVIGLLFLLSFHVVYLSLRVLLYTQVGGPQTLLLRLFVPVGILFPIMLWILLFPTNLFSFARPREARYSLGVCPICGSKRDDVISHILSAHGRGKRGLRSKAARQYVALFGPGDTKE
jgi:hypothetical protein